MILRIAFIVVTVSLGMAPAFAQKTSQNACAIAAFSDYNKANLALMLQNMPVMSIEATISQRRLQEQFCLRFVQCAVDPTNQTSALWRATAFSSCLQDEVRELDK